jgi:O-acetyl-ADP-ribose deacetylase (regulator of RNase III)
MITFTQGNLLEAEAEALVNTVNTVGVMGKGIALMFKEAFPENFREYESACKEGILQVGHMFVTERHDLMGPRWIINFPTKKHWRHLSKMEWIVDGLQDLRRVIEERNINSIALPPLGSGNGGLNWSDVRPLIESTFESLDAVDVLVYEPTQAYQNVMKRTGVEKLTPARALVAELIRRYWILGIECTLLEIQKLAYFLERKIHDHNLDNPMDLRFEANRYGPFAPRLRHLLDALDGSYLHCSKRLADAGPLDVIWFDDAKKDKVGAYLIAEAKTYKSALDATTDFIDGFESPLGMELLATVDWLVHHEGVGLATSDIKEELKNWPGGPGSGARKLKLFDDRLIELAVRRISNCR